MRHGDGVAVLMNNIFRHQGARGAQCFAWITGEGRGNLRYANDRTQQHDETEWREGRKPSLELIWHDHTSRAA